MWCFSKDPKKLPIILATFIKNLFTQNFKTFKNLPNWVALNFAAFGHTRTLDCQPRGTHVTLKWISKRNSPPVCINAFTWECRLDREQKEREREREREREKGTNAINAFLKVSDVINWVKLSIYCDQQLVQSVAAKIEKNPIICSNLAPSNSCCNLQLVWTRLKTDYEALNKFSLTSYRLPVLRWISTSANSLGASNHVLKLKFVFHQLQKSNLEQILDKVL